MILNTIYCEDNVITMDRMEDNFIDITVTSPPYDDMDEDFNPIVKSGLRDYDGYSWDFKRIAELLYKKTKPGGIVCWVINDPVVNGSESLASSLQKIYFKKIGFDIYDTIIYEKNGSLPDKKRYLQCFEYIFIMSKGRPKTINLLTDRPNKYLERWGKGRVVREKNGELTPRGNYKAVKDGIRFNVWRYATGFGYSSKDKVSFEHPASFPEKLAADCIYSWSMEGDLVYDPFCGSGTVPKMAHNLKRKWVASEISKKYVEIAERRIKDHIKTQPLF